MDVISHGLWGGMLLKKKTSFWLALIFGMLPDALPFIPFLAQQASAGNFSFLVARPQAYPAWVFTVYNYTHSLIVAGGIFGILFYVRPNLGRAFLAWPIHILFDIPTHSAACFPTKFLFPLSNLHYNGISWRTGYIFFGNWLAIAIFSLLLAKNTRARL